MDSTTPDQPNPFSELLKLDPPSEFPAETQMEACPSPGSFLDASRTDPVTSFQYQTLVPAVVTSSLLSLPAARSQTKRSHRGRKRKPENEPAEPSLFGPALEAGRRELRAQKNRVFARESRERKKHLLQQQEIEIRSLKAELCEARSRLQTYELIEKQRNMMGNELSEVFKPLLQGAEHPQEFAAAFLERGDRFMDNNRKAMQKLAHMMVEIAVPFPMQLCLWKAEGGADIFEGTTMKRETEKVETPRQLGDGCGVFLEGEKYYKCRQMLREVSQSIRADVKRLLEAQKDIQRGTQKLWDLFKQVVLPKYNATKVKQHMEIFPKLRKNPELSDYAIYHIADQDFGIDVTASDERDAKSVPGPEEPQA